MHRALRPYVASLHAYEVVGEPGVHIGMPSTVLTLVLPVGERLDVRWSDRDETRRRSWSSVSGLHLEPASIHHGRRQEGLMVGLTLAGSRALLGLPAGRLAGSLLDLDDVAPDLADLPERLSEAPAEQRAALVEQRLLATLARRGDHVLRGELGHALARLTRGAPVAAVADEIGYSRRHLHQLVLVESGLSPKHYQRLARFERSNELVAARTTLADVAASCGYADQAHLAREWRELAGCSPTQWQRRELPNVQDPGPTEHRGSMS